MTTQTLKKQIPVPESDTTLATTSVGAALRVAGAVD